MNNKIKIIHLLPNLKVGGMENGIVNLANNISDTKFEIIICCLNSSGDMQNRLNNKNVKVIDLKQKIGRSYKLSFKLANIFKKENVDIVHTHNYYTGVYGVLAAKISRKCILHGLHGFDYDLKRKKFVKTNKEKILFHIADHITCVNDSIKNIACTCYNIKQNKITVIKNGVDSDKFHGQYEQKIIKERLGIDNKKIIIGSVGRLHFQKNYQLLIRAVKTIIKNYDVQLILVGDGPEKNHLKSLCNQKGLSEHINFIGKRDNIPEILSAIDIFVLPSLLEGMSNTILEAMCSGKAIIASNVGGNPELIEELKTGLLFKTNCVDDLIEKLLFFIKNVQVRNIIGKNAQITAREKFSINAMKSQYEKLYQFLNYSKKLY